MSLFVPSEILRVFRDNYPEISLDNVTWSWEVPGKIYEAEFEVEGITYEAEITVTGHLLLTEMNASFDALPAKVKRAFAEKYPDHSVEEVDMITYSNGDLLYELGVINALNGREFEVLFREDGLFVDEGYSL